MFRDHRLAWYQLKTAPPVLIVILEKEENQGGLYLSSGWVGWRRGKYRVLRWEWGGGGVVGEERMTCPVWWTLRRKVVYSENKASNNRNPKARPKLGVKTALHLESVPRTEFRLCHLLPLQPEQTTDSSKAFCPENTFLKNAITSYRLFHSRSHVWHASRYY